MFEATSIKHEPCQHIGSHRFGDTSTGLFEVEVEEFAGRRIIFIDNDHVTMEFNVWVVIHEHYHLIFTQLITKKMESPVDTIQSQDSIEVFEVERIRMNKLFSPKRKQYFWKRIVASNGDIFSKSYQVFVESAVGTDCIGIWSSMSNKKNIFCLSNDVFKSFEFRRVVLHT